MHRFRRHFCAPLLALACSAACAPPVAESVDRLDSPFRMAEDSFAFPNFALGYDASVLDEAGVRRMFGDVVCAGGADPCLLTPPARAFVDEANLAMTGGRCEGFAVLATLMSEGAIAPEDFGAESTRELVLDGNPALQRELAYWFATQLVPAAVVERTKSYMADAVMPALTKALGDDADERYRIGIVRKEGRTVTGGHSLTPLGFYRDEAHPAVYWVRVYDNNRPDFEKLLKIDTANNRWEFEASQNPAQGSRLYYGDESNDNPLWLAPVLSRRGVQDCHFCDGGGTTVSSYGGARVEVEFPDGPVGLSDDGFVEIEGASVTPSFSAALDSEPLAMRIALGPERSREVDDRLETRISAIPDAENPGARQRLSVARADLRVTVSELALTAEDRLITTTSGASYENHSRTALTLETQVLSNGVALTVTVRVASGSDRVETQVDPSSGSVSVDVEGAEGAAVAVELQAEPEGGELFDTDFFFTVDGDVNFAADTSGWTESGAPVEATLTSEGTTETLTAGCLDGVRSGDETDVDCGGGCAAKCGLSQGCAAATDCASGFCDENDGLCVDSSCLDGALSGDETDVDCGGPGCGGCDPGEACASAGDCAAGGACEQGTCVETFAVGVNVSGLALGDSMVLQNNGADDLLVIADGSYTFSAPVAGGFDVTISEDPQRSACTVNDGSGNATDDVLVTVSCFDGYRIGGSLAGLEPGESVTLSSGGEQITLTADGDWGFTDKTLGSYAVSLVAAPAEQNCMVFRGAGNATGDVTDILVQCCALGVTGEGCTSCSPGHGTAPPQCTVPSCGDGILDPGEECDDADADAGDGCSAACGIESGYSCANAVQVNTGSDNAGGKAVLDSSDLVWSWSDPIDGSRTPAVVSGNCAPGQWVYAGPYAEWINRYGCATPSPFAHTTWYHATFTIPTAEAAAVTSVAGTVWADNRIADVLVNGVSTGFSTEGEAGYAGPGISFGGWPSTLYRAGENTITVAVENLGTAPNPDGLLVQVPNAFGTGSVCTLP